MPSRTGFGARRAARADERKLFSRGSLFFERGARIGVEDRNWMNAAPLLAENELLRGLVVSTQQTLTSTQHALRSTQQQLGSTHEQLAQLQQENRLLRQKLDALIRRYFGRSSETLDPKQLELILAGLSAPTPATDAEKAAAHATTRGAAPGRARPPVRQPLPEHLPTERVVIEPEEVKLQPETWKKIGEEVTEELDWAPAQFWRRLFIRPKYVRRDETQARRENAEASSVVIAPLPARLIEKGLPGPGLLAHILISKYEDHLPLYRQEKMYWERHGVALPRQSLAEWVEAGAQWLRPVYERMKRELVSGEYLQVDETPIRYLDPDQPGKAQTGYLWTYSRPGADVIFEWNTSRGRAGPERFLNGYRGRLQTDGYGVYESLARDRAGLVLIGCWAHARRKFFEALDEDCRAAWVVGQIGQLYDIERRLRAAGNGPRLREAVRASEAGPVLRRIETVLRKWQESVLPQSLFGTAIGYALDRWLALNRYGADGMVEIDNNLVENAIRPTAVGKKNWLFIGHPAAGWRSAVLYSVLGSCRRMGIDPHAYLRDVLKRLPAMKITEIGQITPAAWAKAQKAAVKKAKAAA